MEGSIFLTKTFFKPRNLFTLHLTNPYMELFFLFKNPENHQSAHTKLKWLKMREFIWKFGIKHLQQHYSFKKSYELKTLMLRERNRIWKFEACSRIQKRLATFWIFPHICFDFRPAGQTQRQLTTEMCGKIQIVAFSSSLMATLKFSVHNFFKTRVLLKIFDAEFPYKLSYFEPLWQSR